MKLVFVFAALFAVAAARPGTPDSEATILKSSFDNIGVDGYKYAYETSNQISAQEEGQVQNQGTDDEAISVRGQFQYVGPDGVTYAVQYIADENGFQPQGAHIPVANS